MSGKRTRTALCAVLAAISLPIAAQSSQDVTVAGSRSCGTWAEHREDRARIGFGKLSTEAWLLGYLSGLAVATRLDILREPDNAAIFLWMDNYCKANPLDRIDDGGMKLFVELAERARRDQLQK